MSCTIVPYSDLSRSLTPNSSPSEVRPGQTQWSVLDCRRLTTESNRLRQVYGSAVNLLFTTGYAVTDAKYAELKNSVEEARAQWEIAQSRLNRHKATAHLKAEGA
jgi:hypothetical protein